VSEGSGVSDRYLEEDQLGNIKTIFWAFNIVDFAPYLLGRAEIASENVRITGTWFNNNLELPTGETLETGIRNMKRWWDVQGAWLSDDDKNAAMAGEAAAKRLGLETGDIFTARMGNKTMDFTIRGIFSSGGDEDDTIFVPLASAQELADRPGFVSRVEVSALTTPDNELSRRAAQDPNGLSIKEWETWYCTAYVSAICYQIDEVISGAVSKPVRQIAESEGTILKKTQILMLLITILSLAGSALGISNLVSAVVMERSAEIGLLKALGARNEAASALILMEIVITGIAGGIAGYFVGLAFAELIGRSVFDASINIKPAVIPLTALLTLLVTVAGSLPAIRLILRLRPAETLHGR
jgi:putative ABC transport system permease protein